MQDNLIMACEEIYHTTGPILKEHSPLGCPACSGSVRKPASGGKGTWWGWYCPNNWSADAHERYAHTPRAAAGYRYPPSTCGEPGRARGKCDGITESHFKGSDGDYSAPVNLIYLVLYCFTWTGTAKIHNAGLFSLTTANYITWQTLTEIKLNKNLRVITIVLAQNDG